MQGRVAAPIFLSDEERSFLEGQVRRHKVSRSLSERCRIILLCAEGLPSKTVASQLGVHEHTVGKWRRRFVQDRIEGLTDKYRPGRPCTVSDAQVAEVIKQTLETTPKDATHWSIRVPPQLETRKNLSQYLLSYDSLNSWGIWHESKQFIRFVRASGDPQKLFDLTVGISS